MASHDTFLLRIDPAVLEGVRRWAVQDLRSVNRQIEFLLREALLQDGRLNPHRQDLVGGEHVRPHSHASDTADDGDKDAGDIEGS